jgi:hypothetical protein
MTTIKIDNKSVESFLYEQTVVNNISTVDYLTSLVLNEKEFLEIKKDMKTLESEIKQVNEGKIKPRPARLLLNEL